MVDVKKLKKLVDTELNNLERLSKEINELLLGSKEKKDSIEVRAAGSIIHDFYCGIEKIFERVATVIDNHVPFGMNWHTDLLLQMGETIEGIRDRVISEKLITKLKEYLRFRHLFRHLYGFELKWDRIKPLCVEVEDVLSDFKKEIIKFFKEDKLNDETSDGSQD
jgi:hypothetical protein